MVRSLPNNIERYPWFQAASSVLAWLPIFFLYFSQFVSLAEIIQLGALYYFSVCLFEVPSGYFSDRVGRRNTLLISSFAFLMAYLVFLLASDFTDLAIGQIFLALAIAMMSGTDTAFLYDSLLSINQQDSYADCEAKGQKYGFATLSLTTVLGGFLGFIDLRLPYVLSLGGALWMLYLVVQFVEPPKGANDNAAQLTFSHSLIQCLHHLREPILAWLFGVMALMYCLEHIAYEFYQPYIKLLNIQWLSNDSSPLVSGIIIALSMFGGSIGAAYSVKLSNRLGVKTLLIIAMLIQLIIIGSLAFTLSSYLIFTVIFRNFPMAMTRAPVYATIAPFIANEIRATYLSIQSLSARLLFSGVLLYFSTLLTNGEALDWPNLSSILQMALLIGVIGLGVCLFAAVTVKGTDQNKDT